ncbi:MAG TPA: hypothetical protein VFI54_06385 [Solirubrobacteraceae bacterium]|nr:hypothetical protein [Solirubrobacteraceae bacterium]
MSVADPEPDDFEPPDAQWVKRRWIPAHRIEWARRADAIMLEHGAVRGTAAYPKRYQARWRAKALIDLMTDLELHERWELSEHTEKRGGGWTWAVEYTGGRNG